MPSLMGDDDPSVEGLTMDERLVDLRCGSGSGVLMNEAAFGTGEKASLSTKAINKGTPPSSATLAWFEACCRVKPRIAAASSSCKAAMACSCGSPTGKGVLRSRSTCDERRNTGDEDILEKGDEIR